MTKVGLYAIGTSTTLESNKSLWAIVAPRRGHGRVHGRECDRAVGFLGDLEKFRALESLALTK